MKQITAKGLNIFLKNNEINSDDLPELIVKALIREGKTVASAESCTGGYISKRITDVSGASEVFECGACTYANRIKHKLLGVKNETLESVGAVSPETAAQMANGVREFADADFGAATTGIAGPTGGSEEKPVGLVYIAVCDKNSTVVVKSLLADAGDGSREAIRRAATDAVFALLLEFIGKNNKKVLIN